ncbi:hypothetical protein G6F61_014572 [Rhizopus arrhizus]|nr:hypothetical protein G6F61_014572 [Rhizopus arrhizus]
MRPAFNASSCGSVVISVRPTSTWGSALRSWRISSGTKPYRVDGTKPMPNQRRCVWPRRRVPSSTSSRRAVNSRDCSSRKRPASVSRKARVVRSNSCTPNSSSNWRI